ncbi:hypothetical protein ACIRL2_01490 [Embleya sp. NPDC127516]|uniref:hypothetical protein n=1 Tax=Embleya sp. NPDC127516 TaxID=3363990 RepID=UPI00381BA153
MSFRPPGSSPFLVAFIRLNPRDYVPQARPPYLRSSHTVELRPERGLGITP